MGYSLSSFKDTNIFNQLVQEIRSSNVILSSNANLYTGGSGTLIKYKNFYGILTATHVLSKNLDQKIIFSPLQKTSDPTFFINERIPVKDFHFIEDQKGINLLKSGVFNEEALDICLIEIEKCTFFRLLHISEKKFVDLEKHRQRLHSNADLYHSTEYKQAFFIVIGGVPRVNAYHQNGNLVTEDADIYYGKPYEACKTNQLIHVKAGYDLSADLYTLGVNFSYDNLPYTFSGISGGGVWQVAFGGENDNHPDKIEDLIFGGVCVAEVKDEIQCKSGPINYRGPESLYYVFIHYLDRLRED